MLLLGSLFVAIVVMLLLLLGFLFITIITVVLSLGFSLLSSEADDDRSIKQSQNSLKISFSQFSILENPGI